MNSNEESRIDFLHRVIDELQTDKYRLEKANKAAIEELQKKAEIIDMLAGDRREADVEIRKYCEENRILRGDLQEKEESLQIFEATIRNLNDRKQQALADLQEMKDRNRTLVQEKHELTQEVQALEGETHDLSRHIIAQNKQLTALATDLRKVEKAMASGNFIDSRELRTLRETVERQEKMLIRNAKEAREDALEVQKAKNLKAALTAFIGKEINKEVIF